MASCAHARADDSDPGDDFVLAELAVLARAVAARQVVLGIRTLGLAGGEDLVLGSAVDDLHLLTDAQPERRERVGG